MSKSKYHDVRQEESVIAVRHEEATGLVPATAATAYAMAQVKSLENDLMAGLAMQTMQNAMLLSMQEFRCKCDAPEGAEEYRRIVQGYTEAAMQLLWGGER